jgi:hypothetical protein
MTIFWETMLLSASDTKKARIHNFFCCSIWSVSGFGSGSVPQHCDFCYTNAEKLIILGCRRPVPSRSVMKICTVSWRRWSSWPGACIFVHINVNFVHIRAFLCLFRAYSCLFVRILSYSCLFVLIFAYFCLFVLILAYSCLFLLIHAYLYVFVFFVRIRTYSCLFRAYLLLFMSIRALLLRQDLQSRLRI